MGVFVGSVAAGVLGGMLVFAVLRSLWAEAGDLTHLIGIAAACGAIVTAVTARGWARWRDRNED